MKEHLFLSTDGLYCDICALPESNAIHGGEVKKVRRGRRWIFVRKEKK